MRQRKCQICPGGDTSVVFYDAKTLSGSHGYLCEGCFNSVGVYGTKYEVVEKGHFNLVERMVKPVRPPANPLDKIMGLF
jgi:hypothetical protein